MNIRPALVADASAIAQVHVRAWRETYSGLMPDDLLANLSVARRAERWQRILSEPENFDGAAVFIAEHEGAAIGFGSSGKQRTQALKDRGYTAEISALYVLSFAQRRGVGSSLMDALARTLLGRGHRAASLWVLRENAAARGFYERLRGEVVSRKEERRETATLVEIAYGWRDLGDLLKSPSPRKQPEAR